jgi:hypothetical protein
VRDAGTLEAFRTVRPSDKLHSKNLPLNDRVSEEAGECLRNEKYITVETCLLHSALPVVVQGAYWSCDHGALVDSRVSCGCGVLY